MSNTVILTHDDAETLATRYRTEGKRIVTTNGCFDLLHPGHIAFLTEAKAQGDVLFVALNNDDSVRRLKGAGRPILPLLDRIAMLEGLKPVDHVVVFDEDIPIDVLARIRPAVHCKAADYDPDTLPEAEVVRAGGGEVRILSIEPGYSTSRLFEQILVSARATQSGGISTDGSAESQIFDHLFLSANTLRQTAYRLSAEIATVAQQISNALAHGHKVLLCGNGGSAADAQHVAGELVVRYLRDRQPFPAIALSTDSSILTAAGNDYGYEYIFSRSVEALGQPGDILLAISTSGQSPNILNAIQAAKERAMTTIGLTGSAQSPLANAVDFCLAVSSDFTPIIQQAHMAMLHVICDLVEQQMAGEDQG